MDSLISILEIVISLQPHFTFSRSGTAIAACEASSAEKVGGAARFDQALPSSEDLLRHGWNLIRNFRGDGFELRSQIAGEPFRQAELSNPPTTNRSAEIEDVRVQACETDTLPANI